MGGDANLRWFLDAHKELETAETAPAELKQKAEDWLKGRRLPDPACDRVLGISFSAIIGVEASYSGKICDVFRDYGLIDEKDTLADYRLGGKKNPEKKDTKKDPGF